MKKTVFSKERIITLLFLSGPILTILFGVLDYSGFIDKKSGIENLNKAVDRLETYSGYPRSWIFNDKENEEQFIGLMQLIFKNSNSDVKKRIANGEVPTLIMIPGYPLEHKGIPPEWPKEERYFYTDGHSVTVFFDHCHDCFTEESKIDQDAAERIGSLGDLKDWIKEEKYRIRFWFSAIVISLISASLILLRLSLQKRQTRVKNEALISQKIEEFEKSIKNDDFQ